MALIVEDGTGLANAESPNSVEDVRDYFVAWGSPAQVARLSSASEPQIQNACRRAARYQEAEYRSRLRGVRRISTQALSFPRAVYYLGNQGCADAWQVKDPMGGDIVWIDPTVVPVRWKQAHAELVLIALDTDLERSISKENHLQSSTVSGTRADKTTYSTTLVYEAGAPVHPTFTVVDNLVAPYLVAPGKMIRA